MLGNGHVEATTVTLLPTTMMSVFPVHFINGATIQTFHGLAACLGGTIEGQTVGSVKGEMALVAGCGGFLELVVIGAGVGLIPIAGSARGTFAGMVRGIVGVETTITFQAPIGFVHKASDGGTPLIVMLALE